MTRLAFILALLFSAPWQEAEIVDVKDRGAVDLKPFNCQDITRSSVISRVCYDTEAVACWSSATRPTTNIAICQRTRSIRF